MGTLTVNKMALPIEVSAEMVSYSYFYWKKYDCNWVTKLRSRYYCNMSRIRPRLMSCHWSFDLRWVKISGHREQLGPCGSTSHFVNNRHSGVKTRGASCIRGLGQTDGRRKFELRIPQSRGASYIRGASYFRDKTVIQVRLKVKWQLACHLTTLNTLRAIWLVTCPIPLTATASTCTHKNLGIYFHL